MNYKGYNLKLSGVYKIENAKKIYSLEIYKDDEQVYKSDWIYENEKRAFKDAKEMIKKKIFDPEIIRKNRNKETLNNDYLYQSAERKKVANNVIIISILLLALTYIISLFGVNDIRKELAMFVYGYFGVGIFFVIIMLFMGIHGKGGHTLNEKQKKMYSIMWWFNLLFNKGIAPYEEQPFEGNEKGWYSSNVLILLVMELVFIIAIIVGIVESNVYSVLFYSVITGCILTFIIYIVSIIWEVNDATSRNETFPFKRVFSPIISILIIALFVYLYMKVVLQY